MKNEIKEIELDHFKNFEEFKKTVNSWVYYDEIGWERWFSLYDLQELVKYITNLQQRIDKAIKYIEDNKSYTTIEKFVRMNTFEKHDEDILDEEMINKLLNILKGSEE